MDAELFWTVRERPLKVLSMFKTSLDFTWPFRQWTHLPKQNKQKKRTKIQAWGDKLFPNSVIRFVRFRWGITKDKSFENILTNENIRKYF